MPVQVGEEVSLDCSFEKTIYENDGFRILSMSSRYAEGKFPMEVDAPFVDFSVKGNFPAPSYKGQIIKLVGEWRYDNKYKQFVLNVSYALPTLPNNEDDAVLFLKRNVKGIGEKLARRIYQTFGGDLQKIAEDEDVLAATVKGMSINKSSLVCSAIRRVNAYVELTKLLHDKVSSDIIRRIAIRYGSNSLEKIKSNPYEMAAQKTISFKSADEIALALGWQKNSFERLAVGIVCALRALKSKNASIIVDKMELHKVIMQSLDVPEETIIEFYNTLKANAILVSAKKFWYLKNDYEVEKQLSEQIWKYCNTPVSELDSKKYLNCFDAWEKEHPEIQLAENQRIAVKSVADNHLTVVTGGPGTGKTTVMKAVMETYRQTFPDGAITLMAPTGLASKRMSEACDMEANTIHKTLGLTPSDNSASGDTESFEKTGDEEEDVANFLNWLMNNLGDDSGFSNRDGVNIIGGLVVIDEASMVGIYLMNFIFESIVFQRDTRFVIVGDVDQLPPVSPGAVLEDMINCGCVKVTRLNRNFRQEAGSAIIDGAYAINEGNTNLNFTGNFKFKKVEDRDIDIETASILDALKDAFVESINTWGLDQTYVLAPQNKCQVKDGKTTTGTLLSTSSLNPILRDIANPPSADKKYYKAGSRIFREGDRVINLKNTNEVLNGEIGIVEEIQTGDIPVIVVLFDGVRVEYTPDKLKQLDLAYAITVHKSQGCEYKSVLYPTNDTQSAMLQRNLLYTAVTRAKKEVLIIGNRTAIDKSVKTVKNKVKRDLLSARIAYHKVNVAS